MSKLKLEDFLTEDHEFELKGNTLRMRHATLADHAEIKRVFGDKDITIDTADSDNMLLFCKAAFLLIHDEDRAIFKNDPDLFLKVIDVVSVGSIATAFARAMGAKDITEKDLVTMADQTLKKKTKARKKTGRKSTTRSRVSTALL